MRNYYDCAHRYCDLDGNVMIGIGASLKRERERKMKRLKVPRVKKKDPPSVKYCLENRTVFINPARKSVFMESPSEGRETRGRQWRLFGTLCIRGVPERLGSTAEMYSLTKLWSIFFSRKIFIGRHVFSRHRLLVINLLEQHFLLTFKSITLIYREYINHKNKLCIRTLIIKLTRCTDHT